QDTLRFGAEWHLHRGRHFLTRAKMPSGFLKEDVERDLRVREDHVGESSTLTNQSEQEMFGLNREASDLSGLESGKEQHPPCLFRESLELAATIIRLCSGKRR